MYVFVLPVLKIFLNYSSGKFSILAKFWISFKLYWIDPKFHVDREYLVYLVGSSMLRRYRLLPVYFRKICIKLPSELCSLHNSKDSLPVSANRNALFDYFFLLLWISKAGQFWTCLIDGVKEFCFVNCGLMAARCLNLSSATAISSKVTNEHIG